MNEDLRFFLDRRFTAIVAVLLLLALVGGYVAYTAHAETETVTEERVVSTATTSTDFNHGVTVQRDAIVFEEGVSLRDRTLYFTTLSPELEGNYTVGHGGSDPVPAATRAELTLVLRSVSDEGVEYWRESETLATVEEASLQPGEPLEAEFTVNVTETLLRIEEIEENLGASPGDTQVLVVADSAIEGMVGGEEFAETRSESLRIDPGTGTYTVSVDLDGQNSHEATETVETEIEPSALSAYGSVVVVVVSVLALLGMLVGRRVGLLDVPPETAERMEFESQRDSLDEWISRGRISGDTADTQIELESLEGLVDVAIDSNRRVTELDDGRYVVLVDGVRYVYEPSFEMREEGEEDSTEDANGEDAPEAQ